MAPFRFCVQVKGIPDAAEWAATARRVEDLGYDVLTMADHLDSPTAPIASLVAAANATTTLRLGTAVLANDFRHPAVLAAELATLDALSGGRLEWGLGAGWQTTDYEQTGIALDRPGERIDRLAEAVQIIKGLFGEEPVTFAGEHYTINGLNGLPKPIQTPPPLLIGGGGRRVLTLAAREADIVGINISLATGVIDARVGPNATAQATDDKVGWIREAAGSRFDALDLQVRVHLAAISDDPQGFAEVMGPALGIEPDQAMQTPHALVGSVEQCVEMLLERRERWGINMVTWGGDQMVEMAPVVEALAGH